jgi:DNA-binding PadR family transcriptional regulator
VQRGDVRTALFAFLIEQPGHGYEVMQYLEAKTSGKWRPSPGSIYPALQQLEDEGLVRSEEKDGRRVYRLTTTGKKEAKARLAERGAPWERPDEQAPELGELSREITKVRSAATEILKLGDGDRLRRGIDVIRDARKQLYQLLAED